MGEIAIQEEMNGMERDEKQDQQNKIGFENLVETPFMNGKREQVISLLTVINDIPPFEPVKIFVGLTPGQSSLNSLVGLIL